MKKFIINIAVFTAIASALGCNEVLEEKVETFYLPEQVFKSEEGIETAVNGLYATFSAPQYYGTAWHCLVNPHSGKFFSNQSQSSDATSLNCTPNNIWVGDMWAKMFETVNVANNVIYNIENNNVNLPNEQLAIAQARFIRAVTYFDLVRLFGAVPLRTTPTTLENIHLPKSSKQAIYQQIMSDLEFAKQNLPEKGQYLTDRPKKWAAYAYMAKVYMQLAGEDGGNPQMWQNAYNEAIQVYNKYTLNPSFASLFVPGVENTAESIFELQYADTGAIRNSDMPRVYTPANSTFAPANQTTFGRIRPNKEVFDQHTTQYPGDPRIAATYIFNSYVRSTGGVQNIYPTQKTGNNSFVAMRKWLDPTYNGSTTSRNYILLRYADILLMLAEIENEINGPTNAYQYVNMVLKRARDANGNGIVDAADSAQPADFAGMTQSQFRDRIMKERQYELLSEGQDWFDGRRRGYQYFLQTVVNPHNSHAPNLASGGVDYIYPISVKNMLLPIPAVEFAGNNAMSPADQNPGY